MPDDTEHLTAQWHEARAADLIRPEPSGNGGTYSPSPAARDLARIHVELAKSLRLAQLTVAIGKAGASNRDGLGRIAERLHNGLRGRR